MVGIFQFYNDYVFKCQSANSITIKAGAQCALLPSGFDTYLALSGTNTAVSVYIYDTRIQFDNIPISTIGFISGVYR